MKRSLLLLAACVAACSLPPRDRWRVGDGQDAEVPDVSDDVTMEMEAGPDATIEAGAEAGADARVDVVDSGPADAGCPMMLPAPRLIAPLAGSVMAVIDPDLEVEAPVGATEVEFLISNRASRADFAGATSVRVPVSPGTRRVRSPRLTMLTRNAGYFWSSVARCGTTVTSAMGTTWGFRAGGRAGWPASVVERTMYDYNGDNIEDIAVGGATSGTLRRVVVHRGGMLTLFDVLSGTTASNFGRIVARGGDIDGDGFGDLLVTTNQASANNEVRIYRGGIAGVSSTPITIDGTDGTRSFLGAVASVGDINRDGYGDFAYAETGHVYVARGAATIATRGFVDITLASAEGFGSAIAGGDFNGDGYSDLVIGAKDSMSRGAAVVYTSTMAGPSTTPTMLLTGDTFADDFGATLAVGCFRPTSTALELIVGAPLSGALATSSLYGKVFHFSSPLIGGTGTAVAIPSAQMPQHEERYGATLVGLGDTDGDGASEFAVASPRWDSSSSADTGRVFWWEHNGTAFSLNNLVNLSGVNALFGATLAPAAGSLGGTGSLLFTAVGMPGNDSGVGAVRFYQHAGSGAASPLIIASTVAGPAGYTNFGISLAANERSAPLQRAATLSSPSLWALLAPFAFSAP